MCCYFSQDTELKNKKLSKNIACHIIEETVKICSFKNVTFTFHTSTPLHATPTPPPLQRPKLRDNTTTMCPSLKTFTKGTELPSSMFSVEEF